MSNQRQLLQIRNKKLGLLIADARKAQRRSVEECADATGVSTERFVEWEQGKCAPSLPQMELLALFLATPLDHFWGKEALNLPTAAQPVTTVQEKDRLLLLRNRVIGANLRLARNKANLSTTEINNKTGITEEQLKQYELGSSAIPMTELEMLCNLLDASVEQFYDQHGPVGRWRSQQGSTQRFFDLPPEVQEFVAMPVNRPYLELAMRLSEMSAEKLRAVAEVLLEITY